MVFAMFKDNMNASIPCIFRSYHGYANQMPNCFIWEALRAAMAHPDLFKSIEIGESSVRQSFVGAELGCSNPTAHVLTEVGALYPDKHVASVVSIGGGHTRTIHIPKPDPFLRIMPTNVLITMKAIATDSERVAEDMAIRFQNTTDVYFRFSVDQGMQNLSLSKWQRQSEVVAHTRQYMQKVEVSTKISQAARAITEGKAALRTAQISTCTLRFYLTLPHIAMNLGGKIQLQPMERLAGVKRCPAPSPVFTGHEAQVLQVQTCLIGVVGERRICVIHGLGGAGKTQVALRAIERTKNHWVDIIYVDATSQDTTISTLTNFAKAKAIGDTPQDTIQWLESHNQPWLLVFDNADDHSLKLPEFIPQGSHGSILITTRLRGLALLAQGPSSACEVSGMDQQDAMELLLKKARMEDQELSHDEMGAAAELVKVCPNDPTIYHVFQCVFVCRILGALLWPLCTQVHTYGARRAVSPNIAAISLSVPRSPSKNTAWCR
jgi:hypothetical protein